MFRTHPPCRTSLRSGHWGGPQPPSLKQFPKRAASQVLLLHGLCSWWALRWGCSPFLAASPSTDGFQASPSGEAPAQTCLPPVSHGHIPSDEAWSSPWEGPQLGLPGRLRPLPTAPVFFSSLLFASSPSFLLIILYTKLFLYKLLCGFCPRMHPEQHTGWENDSTFNVAPSIEKAARRRPPAPGRVTCTQEDAAK